MEPISITVVAAFLGACLYKAGEKFSEKSIETIFEKRKELAENFTRLFRDEIITLDLSNATDTTEVNRQLSYKPEIAKQALAKLIKESELMDKFNEQLQKESDGKTVNIEKIGQYIETNYGNITQNITM